MWYEWVAPGDLIAKIDTSDTGWDTKLGVYEGSDVIGLATVVQDDDKGGGWGESAVEFSATNGTSYKIAVTSYSSSNQGKFFLNGATNATPVGVPSNNDFANRITVSGSSWSVSGNVANATAQSVADGQGGSYNDGTYYPKSVWYSWTCPTTSKYEIKTYNAWRAMIKFYTGTVFDSLTKVESWTSSGSMPIYYDLVGGTTYQIKFAGYYTAACLSDFTIDVFLYVSPVPDYVNMVAIDPVNDTNIYTEKGIVRDSTGRFWVMADDWSRTGGDWESIFYSDDNGLTWAFHSQFPTVYNQFVYGEEFSLVVDTSDNLHAVVVERNTSSGYSIIYSRLQSGQASWDSPEVVYDGTSSGFINSIWATMTSTGKVHAIWYGYDGTEGSIRRLWHAIKDGTWGSKARINPGVDIRQYWIPLIESDGDNNIHLLYSGYNNTSGTYGLYYGIYDDSWTLSTILESVDNQYYSYGLTIDINGNSHIVYFDGWWESIFYKVRFGGVWGEEEIAVSDPNSNFDDAISPYVNADASIVTIFYYSYTSNNDVIKAATKSSGVWGDSIYLTDPQSSTSEADQMGFAYSSFFPNGQNAASDGWCLCIPYYYYSPRGWKVYFVYHSDLDFGPISGPSIFNATALNMDMVFYSKEQYLGYVPVNGLYMNSALYDPILLPGSVFAQSLSMDFSLLPRAILTPTQKIKEVTKTTVSKEWSPLITDIDIEQTDSFSEQGGRFNLKSIRMKQDKPVIFGSRSIPVNFYTRPSTQPVIFYTRYTISLIYRFLTITIPSMVEDAIASIVSTVGILSQSSKSVSTTVSKTLSTITIAESTEVSQTGFIASGVNPPTENQPNIAPSPSGEIAVVTLAAEIQPGAVNTFTTTFTTEVT